MSLGAISANLQDFSVAQCLKEKADRLMEHIAGLQKQLDDERRYREGKYAGVPTDAISGERFELLHIISTLQRRIEYEFNTLEAVQSHAQAQYGLWIASTGGGVPILSAPPPHTLITPPSPPVLSPIVEIELPENVARHDILLDELMALKNLVLGGMQNAMVATMRAAKQTTPNNPTSPPVNRVCARELRKSLHDLRASLRAVAGDVGHIRQAFGLTFQKCVDTILENDRQKDTIVRYHQHVVDMANQNITLLLELKSNKHHHNHHSKATPLHPRSHSAQQPSVPPLSGT
jgi:hypothetical protein